MKLVLIRAGNFRMGSPDSDQHASADEKPQHRVRISKPFYLGKYEVTRGEFRKFVAATEYSTQAEMDGSGGYGYSGQVKSPFGPGSRYTWRNAGFEQTDQHPVINVSWNDAVKFCEWLSSQEKKTYRLPTEAEWEWACRAGTIDRWSCGDEEANLKTHANVLDVSLGEKAAWPQGGGNWNDASPFTSPVGKYKANPFGLHDMHGNVMEWCSDWFDPKYYANSPIKDPRGPADGSNRVLRGGCWYLRPLDSRSGDRCGVDASLRHFNIGFRVVRMQSADSAEKSE